jgi:cyclophilin family peptidyl-prolyl cis-trans isomerase
MRDSMTLAAASLAMALVGLASPFDAQTPAKPTPKPGGTTPAPAPAAGPIVTLETAKGVIVFETYPLEAPRSVEHILKLIKRRFYDGQAVHRTVAGQLVQFGDQQTRNMQLKEWWGRGPNSGSGTAIGVAEISKRLKHRRGTVSLANPGAAASADSQMFIALRAAPAWDGKYAIIGQVTSGMEIAAGLAVGDRIKRVTAAGVP